MVSFSLTYERLVRKHFSDFLCPRAKKKKCSCCNLVPVANVALYSTFATTAFMSGTIVNKLGPRLSLSIGYVSPFFLFFMAMPSFHVLMYSAYSCQPCVFFFSLSGSVLLTLFVGSWYNYELVNRSVGYTLFIGSYLSYNINQNRSVAFYPHPLTSLSHTRNKELKLKRSDQTLFYLKTYHKKNEI